jgi:hypothetical protein
VFGTFNGTRVETGALIYYDELSSGTTFADVINTLIPLRDQYERNTGALYCAAINSMEISWYFPNGSEINQYYNNKVYTLHSSDGRFPFKARIQRVTDDDNKSPVGSEGLWTCRHKGSLIGAVPVGVYQRARMFIV